MFKVEIRQDDGKLSVYSQYNPAFVRRSHKLCGIWNDLKKVWVFDGRDEARIRKVCMDVYGTDGSTPDKLFTLQAKANHDIEVSLGSVYFAGHQIARAWDRDSGAKLGDGVLMLEGEIKSGGSRRYWTSIVREGSVIEIKDLTLQQVELARKSSERYEKWEILSIEEQENQNIEEVLIEEEKKLKRKLKEIRRRRRVA